MTESAEVRIAGLEALLAERDARIAELEDRVAYLVGLVEEVRREGKRQAAPFRKTLKEKPERPGRKAGGGDGAHSFRRRPVREADRVVAVPLPASCPGCGGGQLSVAKAVAQFVEDLPATATVLTRFDIEVGRCECCQANVQGRHPEQASDAYGAAAAQVGPRALAFAAYLHKVGGLSLGKTVAVLKALGLTVTGGGLAQGFARLAAKGELTYQSLIGQIRDAPHITADETGWRVGAGSAWLWAFVAAQATIYAILPGRGFSDATMVLPRDFCGVLVRDGWAPYRQYRKAVHQSCLAHLLRRAGELCLSLPAEHHHIPRALARILHDALLCRGVRDQGGYTDQQLGDAVAGLEARLDTLITTPAGHADTRRLLKHLANEQAAILTFLYQPGVDATNWRGETGIRPAVVNRKVWGGNRTNRGADVQQILMTLFRTAAQQGRDIIDTFASILTSPTPTVALHLTTPNPPSG